MEEKKSTIIQTMVSNFKKSKKDLIIQIIWIVAIGIIGIIIRNNQSVKQETKEQVRQAPGITEEQKNTIIQKICTQAKMDYNHCVENLKQSETKTMEELCLETANERVNLSGEGQGTIAMLSKEYQQCIGIWGNNPTEEK